MLVLAYTVWEQGIGRTQYLPTWAICSAEEVLLCVLLLSGVRWLSNSRRAFSIVPRGLWNGLPSHPCLATSLMIFRRPLKTKLFSWTFHWTFETLVYHSSSQPEFCRLIPKDPWSHWFAWEEHSSLAPFHTRASMQAEREDIVTSLSFCGLLMGKGGTDLPTLPGPFLHTQVSVPKGRCFHVSPSLLHVGEELWNGGGGKGCFIVELGPALCSAEEVHIPPPQPFSTLACGCRRKGETLLLHAGEGMRRGNSSPIFLCLQWLTRKGWETLPYKNCFKSIVFLVFCFAKMDSVNWFYTEICWSVCFVSWLGVT